ncbi:VOC family protein [Streptomyces chryseus]
MTSLVHHVTIDCADAYRLAGFWADVFGVSISDEDAPGDPEALVETPGGAALLFIAVPEAKSIKNRLHLDLMPDDRTRDEEVERLLALGATLVADHRRPNGRGWATMADPEGNEFCVECGAAERAALSGTRLPVTADDVTTAVRLAVDALGEIPADDWTTPAGSLEWTRWETAEHMSDDLFSYAARMGPREPSLDGGMPYRVSSARAGGPATAIFAAREAGPRGLLRTLEASGALLAAMVRTASPDLRCHHAYGISDPEGFAAMGVVETLVHTHDVAQGLSRSWTPPADLCDRALARLFPEAPADEDRWAVLLWATGRAELPGRGRVAQWKWHSAPL